MKTQNILRIRVNGFNLLKLSLINNKDFIFSYPKTNVSGQVVDSHFTLHSLNDRVTFKIISLTKQKKDMLSYVLKLAKTNPVLTDRIVPIGQIDLLKGKIFDMNDVYSLIDICIGMAVNIITKPIEELFVIKKSKSEDNSFLTIKEVTIPLNKTAFSFKCLVGKNFVGTIDNYINNSEDHCWVKSKTVNGDEYTFLFLLKYKFPDVTPSKSSIVI